MSRELGGWYAEGIERRRSKNIKCRKFSSPSSQQWEQRDTRRHTILDVGSAKDQTVSGWEVEKSLNAKNSLTSKSMTIPERRRNENYLTFWISYLPAS